MRMGTPLACTPGKPTDTHLDSDSMDNRGGDGTTLETAAEKAWHPDAALARESCRVRCARTCKARSGSTDH